MIEEKIFERNEIKEIRLNWDFENVIFPINKIRKFSYHSNQDKMAYYGRGLYASEIYLEVDLDFVWNACSYYDFVKTDDKKNIDCLKYNNVWYIAIKTTDNQEYELEVPFFSKDILLDKNVNIYNVKNVFEVHKKTSDSYIIEWKYDKKLTKFTLEEAYQLLQNEKKRGAAITNNNFQIEVLSELLMDKEDRLSFLNSFCKLVYENIYQVKKGYEIKVISKEENSFNLCYLNIKNHSYIRNIYFVLIKNINNLRELYDLLQKVNNKTSSYYKYKMVFIIDNTISFNVFPKDFIENKNIIWIRLEELNTLLFQMIYSGKGGII